MRQRVARDVSALPTFGYGPMSTPWWGAIGYIAAGGAMDSCIALRTAVVKDGTMYVQAGGGVVADSNPEAEFQETVNKAKALMAAADEAVRYASMPKRGQ